MGKSRAYPLTPSWSSSPTFSPLLVGSRSSHMRSFRRVSETYVEIGIAVCSGYSCFAEDKVCFWAEEDG